MKKTAILSFIAASIPATHVLAGIRPPALGNPIPQLSAQVPPLGDPTPELGGILPQLGSDLSVPTLTAIAVISLVAGIRYIRNKRS